MWLHGVLNWTQSRFWLNQQDEIPEQTSQLSNITWNHVRRHAHLHRTFRHVTPWTYTGANIGFVPPPNIDGRSVRRMLQSPWAHSSGCKGSAAGGERSEPASTQWSAAEWPAETHQVQQTLIYMSDQSSCGHFVSSLLKIVQNIFIKSVTVCRNKSVSSGQRGWSGSGVNIDHNQAEMWRQREKKLKVKDVTCEKWPPVEYIPQTNKSQQLAANCSCC